MARKGLTRIDDVWTGAEGDKQPIATDVHGKLPTWVGETDVLLLSECLESCGW